MGGQSKRESNPVKRVRSRGPATRRRILESAYELIADKGINNVAMTDISKHAQVAERTLYNIFESKNKLILELVKKYQADIAENVTILNLRSLDRIIQSIFDIAADLEGNINWAEAISHLYFNSGKDADLYESLHGMGLHHFDMAIAVIFGRQKPDQCELLGKLRHQYSNTGYALLYDLSMRRIDGYELGRHLALALETSMIALARFWNMAVPPVTLVAASQAGST